MFSSCENLSAAAGQSLSVKNGMRRRAAEGGEERERERSERRSAQEAEAEAERERGSPDMRPFAVKIIGRG